MNTEEKPKPKSVVEIVSESERRNRERIQLLENRITGISWRCALNMIALVVIYCLLKYGN